MGSDVEDTSSSHFSFTSIFESVCPEYMAMGMSYDEFWNGEPKIAKYYREAEIRKIEKQNQMLWVQGIYFAKAIESTICVQLSGKKGGNKPKYPTEPLPITDRMQKAIEEKKQQEEFEKLKAQLMSWAINVNKNQARKEVK